MAVKPIPDGYHSITPYLIINGAARALEFYKKVFGATETLRFDGPDGTIAHAEVRIGDSMVMLADESEDMGFRAPQSTGGSPVGIMLYVDDVDRIFNRAVAEGASVKQPLEDKFYGDRAGTVVDPFGHLWTISTHTEDVSPEEMQRRMAAMAP